MSNPSLVLIGGPTASGKSSLAFEAALRFSCEIINADSRQIYRDLLIGTNQPTEENRRKVAHHLYGFLHPAESFSAGDYERLAVPLVQEIQARNRIPLVVGGTGFYMKSLLKGVWAAPPKNLELRKRLQGISHRRGNSFLHKMLRRMDPDSASKIFTNDTYRVVRALEIIFQARIKPSSLQEGKERFHAWKFYLDPDRTRLREEIQNRTERMFQDGWVEEVRRLMVKYPGFETMPAAASIGYRQIVQFLKGEIDLSACKEIIVRKTGQYAKRQLTWFRNQDYFVRLIEPQELHKILESVLQ